MTSRRDRAVSLATVLLALAGGVALGGGPLQGEDGAASASVGDAAPSTDGGEDRALEEARAFDDAYVEATAAEVLGGRLDGRAVTLVTLPGADPARVAELDELVGAAGGVVTVQAEVLPAFLDVGNRQLVAELAKQTQAARRTSVDVPGGTEGYELAARLLGRALVDPTDAGAPVDQGGESILAGFTTAGLVTTSEPVTRRGSVVLLVAGAPTGSADARQGAATIVTDLAAGLDASGDGAVVAGPAAASGDDGVVGALRAGPARRDVSTVDALDTLAGGVVAVRALAEEARGRTGHHGSSESRDGLLPR